MLYVLFGEDEFSLGQALREIKKSIGDETALATNTTVLEGPRLALGELRNACETVPFLAEKRLVVVEGLLGRFETRAKTGRARTKASPKEEYKPFGEYLGKTPPTAVVVLVDGKIDGRNPLLTALAGKGKVLSFPLLKEAALRQWVQKRVKEKSGSISPTAVDLLVRFVGSNLLVMANEVDKLILFVAGRRIEEEDVRSLVSYTQEASVFTMVDAILEFKAGLAEQLLQRLFDQGAAPPYLLLMLARQVQLIVRVKELKNQGKTEREVRNRLASINDFVVRKALEQGDRYSSMRLREVYHRLLDTDLAIKTGRYDPELALNMLIAELCQQRQTS